MSVRENLANLGRNPMFLARFPKTSWDYLPPGNRFSTIYISANSKSKKTYPSLPVSLRELTRKKRRGLTIAFQGPQERIRQGSKTHSARHDYIMNTVPHSIHSPWLKHKTQATKTQNPANQTRQANRTTVAPKTTQNQGLRKPYSYRNHHSQISASDLRGSQQEPYEQKVQANPTAVQAPPSNVYKRQIPEANRIENQSSTTTGYTHL
ncbi:hypothetical protein J3Q64DRAFT_1852930 [Phycomyces blakesleeanus]|uniref:Uncharacterized protein n=2 Tax=Phycomyces blakesleeanus TaxID=4837 RepID=A0A162PPH0_PHYB8|nr:hypothetical protein PHYBLDRAFT_147449 [Phycomyces blakesleeanus NRRL 1555(-)]OAD71696.1 hypothetical protein PHYBLDRAFT_147449 [Phycomyces blakesleeanus NRRL 1555(-)]|eukprot:XP_018289736.1 hypothetical protein PHYBLDRAFT_147449 [Phycomyces blakesleeanus NRRL 1555(-)]